ncbi:MAG TPA: hypothetical protein PK200_10365, partial [Spirochaetota bacterium]|nr:hypothetical protein [Spirochaetota bacterium]
KNAKKVSLWAPSLFFGGAILFQQFPEVPYPYIKPVAAICFFDRVLCGGAVNSGLLKEESVARAVMKKIRVPGGHW